MKKSRQTQSEFHHRSDERRLHAFCGKPVIGRSNSSAPSYARITVRSSTFRNSRISRSRSFGGSQRQPRSVLNDKIDECFARSGMSLWSRRRSANQRAPRKNDKLSGGWIDGRFGSFIGLFDFSDLNEVRFPLAQVA